MALRCLAARTIVSTSPRVISFFAPTYNDNFSSSLAMSIESRPIPSAMLMCAEQSFLLCAIDCLLGGAPDRVPPAVAIVSKHRARAQSH